MQMAPPLPTDEHRIPAVEPKTRHVSSSCGCIRLCLRPCESRSDPRRDPVRKADRIRKAACDSCQVVPCRNATLMTGGADRSFLVHAGTYLADWHIHIGIARSRCRRRVRTEADRFAERDGDLGVETYEACIGLGVEDGQIDAQ
ncbi:hypothetical protein AXG93_1736s1070 [Marchantia polymorpha subsp. ruderalis]|uniref:Uncharacterized protein n=1 Tax=Marchantia polymorpha subsp. ruderalis TaxID=1480154 RepID=A0A176W7B5_MARPO|nr:hypothetical protein AXG93_1736s1070 [Marchantia polymorpha subsp. ruderalis]